MNPHFSHTYLLVNPKSGSYSENRLHSVLQRLQEHQISPEVFHVQTPTEIGECCRGITLEQTSPLVIVAGGDGTFNVVVNSVAPKTVTLAVLPFGTSNVLAAEIGITSIDDGINRIITGNSKLLSLGVIECEGKTLRFVLMAGIGLDGATVRGVTSWGKRVFRQGAYGWSALKCVLAWDQSLFTVRTPTERITCHSAIICNAARYGGNFILSPESSPFIHGLKAFCITSNRRRTYLTIIRDLFCGKKQRSTNLHLLSETSIWIDGTKAIQVDGDFIGHAPARITTEPDFARMIQ